MNVCLPVLRTADLVNIYLAALRAADLVNVCLAALRAADLVNVRLAAFGGDLAPRHQKKCFRGGVFFYPGITHGIRESQTAPRPRLRHARAEATLSRQNN